MFVVMGPCCAAPWLCCALVVLRGAAYLTHMSDSLKYDVLIIGAGAAGLMCAAIAARRGRSTLVVDHAPKPAEKVRISGGGRCNFTNLHSTPDNFLSANPHFAKSALARYTPYDFLDLVERYRIAWHEKNPERGTGQLFCDGKSTQIVDMLVAEVETAGGELWLETEVGRMEKTGRGFTVELNGDLLTCESLVVACGGPSIPKMGASRFGYRIADQFGLDVIEPVAALVPLTFTDDAKAPMKELAGVAVDARVTNDRTAFDEPVLFTHRGLSGPGILQISSYWRAGESITLDMAPGRDVLTELKELRTVQPRVHPANALRAFVPERLARKIAATVKGERLADLSDASLTNLALQVGAWHLVPAGSEGFRTAEVTRGGVDTDALSSKTLEARTVPGLYFIGEVVDVTGHLGGHNFQWAWASGVAAGEAV